MSADEDMTAVLGPARPATSAIPGLDPEALQLATGRAVSLRFLRRALRRRRPVWVALLVAGLLGGAAYGVLAPHIYDATATVYLTHFAGTSSTVDAKDDLALLDTPSVGARALRSLRDNHLTPQQLLGKAPGQLMSDDVLVITIAGSTPAQAVARVNAVAHAFLSFRAEQYGGQMQALITGSRREIAGLDKRARSLGSQIARLPAGRGAQLQSLIAARGAITGQVTNLRQAIQQDQLQALEIAKGSRVITPGAVAPTSKGLPVALDGLFALLAGGLLGVGGVLAGAILSDKLRWRDDIAAVLGAPVALSVGAERARTFLRSARGTEARPLEAAGTYFAAAARRAADRRLLVVTVDDPSVAAPALAFACRAASAEGTRVVAVDATDNLALVGHLARDSSGRQAPPRTAGVQHLDLGGAAPVTLVVPGAPWDPAYRDRAAEWNAALAEASLVLALATTEPGVGAAHLREWSDRATVTVRAGGATATRIDAVARLLDAAGIAVTSAVLFDAERDDESAGLPEPGQLRGAVHQPSLVPVGTVAP